MIGDIIGKKRIACISNSKSICNELKKLTKIEEFISLYRTI